MNSLKSLHSALNDSHASTTEQALQLLEDNGMNFQM